MIEAEKAPSRKRAWEDYMRERLQKARAAVTEKILHRSDAGEEIDLVEPYAASAQLLGDYVTLDWPHYQAIRRVRLAIFQYAEDRSRRRPLNIMMQAEPGSGKSHLVRCLADSITHHKSVAISYNMAGLQSIEDLVQPLDEVRNVKVQDMLPILFLDEFDSDPARYSLLLPLMWDGELNVAHRNLKLGKLVVILAGSSPAISAAMNAARGMQVPAAVEGGKLIDLVSRINGGELEIPPMDIFENERDRRTDKVCLTISLLRSRFGPEIELIPLSLLRFVAATKFRYGVRSIAHLVDLILPFPKDAKNTTQLSPTQLRFPLDNLADLRGSSLAYHLFSEDGAAAIIEQWRTFSADDANVRVRKELGEEDMP